MKYFVVFQNDGVECDDVKYKTLSEAKEALKSIYLDDWAACEEEPQEDYYIEKFYETEDELLSLGETHYTPYINKKGGVSLKKVIV